jgi:hypothetical protein
MGEVITVDFVRKARTVANPIFDRFAEMLARNGIVEDDIQDVLEAIRDPKFYETCDDIIKRIVDVWFEHTASL